MVSNTIIHVRRCFSYVGTLHSSVGTGSTTPNSVNVNHMEAPSGKFEESKTFFLFS